MRPLAMLCAELGFRVQGSDAGDSPASLDSVKVFHKHEGSNIDGANTLVYSSAISDENPELLAARSSGIEVLHRSELLNRFVEMHETIAVAGTHGKTTISAMLTHMLTELGADPSSVVGGVMRPSQRSHRLGYGKSLIIEADESDGSFLNYRPLVGLVSSLAADHMAFFGDMSRVQATFAKFLSNIHPDGRAVIFWDQSICRDLGQGAEVDVLSYGSVIGSDVRLLASPSQRAEMLHFQAVVERDLVSVSIPMFGKHNVMNALACLAVARAWDLPVVDAARSLACFQGVHRRQDLIYASDDLRIYDDYAHNPEKIDACLAALREAWPSHRLVCVYEPHRYSRTMTQLDEFASSFTKADLVYLLPIFAAGEKAADEFSLARFATEIGSRSSVEVRTLQANLDEVSEIAQSLPKPAIIVTIGAGSVWRISHALGEQHSGKKKDPMG